MARITIKITKNIKNFIQKIKPKSSKNLSKKNINIIWDILYGLVKGQKCFLNTIVENMKYYKDSLKETKAGKRKKALNKISQINKISKYLWLNLEKFKIKFLKEIMLVLNPEVKDFNELKKLSIKERVKKQSLLIHDTSDIQKPFAKKMEKLGKTRDWSSHKRNKSWKWYYIEWVILVLNWRITPLLLTLFSEKDETDSKKITRLNMNYLSKIFSNLNWMINIFDRWYDSINFIENMLEKTEFFIIRWVKTRSIIDPEYYNNIAHKCDTQMITNNIFSSVKVFSKLENICNMLGFANYYNVFQKFNDLEEKSLEWILEQESLQQKHSIDLFNLSVLIFYFQFCAQKNLDFTPDSFAKFVKSIIWNDLVYIEAKLTLSW